MACISTSLDVTDFTSRPTVAISFRLTSEFHCAQCDKPFVSSSISRFDLVKSNEETSIAIENT
ncbi:hypothetical protein [Lacihabitans sp. LS3-19]|uniref:hypothetical protein n=1 Tax=Lacihabitans sp. LS3-19 TaxID=2487335 RepID=UPI0020CEC536|nr:hypothetical protein [Lacihabitans sp. LS3-19]